MRHLTYANVMATIAVFVALGGSSYAALKVTGRDVRDGSLTGRDIRDGSLRGRDIKDRSIGKRDLKRGVIRRGPAGPRGPKGDPGPTGTVDTSAFYDKAASDARFLPIGGKAADAALLDGTPKSGFVGTSGGFAALPAATPSPEGCVDSAHFGRVASDGAGGGAWLCTADGWQILAYPHATLETVQLGPDLGIHVTLAGFAPNTPVSYGYTIPGGGGAGPLGNTDASGSLDATVAVNSCGASGSVHDWRIVVGGRVALILRRAYPVC